MITCSVIVLSWFIQVVAYLLATRVVALWMIKDISIFILFLIACQANHKFFQQQQSLILYLFTFCTDKLLIRYNVLWTFCAQHTMYLRNILLGNLLWWDMQVCPKILGLLHAPLKVLYICTYMYNLFIYFLNCHLLQYCKGRGVSIPLKQYFFSFFFN